MENNSSALRQVEWKTWEHDNKAMDSLDVPSDSSTHVGKLKQFKPKLNSSLSYTIITNKYEVIFKALNSDVNNF